MLVMASSSSSLLHQINDDYLTCQICMEPYQSPKVLTCLHTFCKKCLDLCEKSTHETYILCPICRQKTTLGMKGVDGLKNNFVLSNMATVMEEWKNIHSRTLDQNESIAMCQTCPENESIIATYQCINCLDQLCADCAAFHNRTKLTKAHKVVSLQDIEAGKFKDQILQEEMSRCKTHKNEKFELYCHECNKLVCKECITKQHQGHLLISIDEASIKFHEEIKELQEKMETMLQSTEHSLKILEELQEKNQDFCLIEKSLEQEVENLILAIKERQFEMVKTIKERQKNNEEHLTVVKDNYENKQNCIVNCIQLSKCVVKNGTTREMQSLKEKMQDTMRNLHETLDKTSHMLTFENIKYLPEEFSATPTTNIGNIHKEEILITSLIANENNEQKLFVSDQPLNLRNSNANCTESFTQDLFVELPKQKLPLTPKPKPRKKLSNDITLTKNNLIQEKSSQVPKSQKNNSSTSYKNNMTLYRVAPKPPPKDKQSHSKAKSSVKKPPAPLPPSVSSIVKAKFNLLFKLRDLDFKDNSHILQGLAITKDHILALDAKKQQVNFYNKEGGCSRKFLVKNPKQGINNPTSLTVSTAGIIYVLYSQLVTAWSEYGTYQSSFGQHQLKDAHGIVTDNDGRIIIADEGNHQITIFDTKGVYMKSITKDLHTPRYVCTTSKNHIVVTDIYHNHVRIFDSHGQLTSICNSNESKLVHPQGIASIQENRNSMVIIAIADMASNRITAYNCQGKFLYHILESSKDHPIKDLQCIAVFNSKQLVLLQNESKECHLYNL